MALAWVFLPAYYVTYGAYVKPSYADGDFYWFNDGGNFAALTSQNWEKWFPGDFAFTATFTDGADNRVPEPGLLALLGIGALGLAASKRRKAA